MTNLEIKEDAYDKIADQAMNAFVVKMYLDYVNNYITTAAVGEAYGLSPRAAVLILADGERAHRAQLEANGAK